MSEFWQIVVGAAVLVVVVATSLSIAAILRFRARARTSIGAPPRNERVTVLKPLCGRDDALEANLETFFRTTGPPLTLVFGVEGEDDPAADVVRRLRARFPAVDARLVIHDGGRALNPKVSNLDAMLEAAPSDLVVISDSNVAVAHDWLARMVADFHGLPRGGLLTSLFVGVGEETLGATLENLHLVGPVAGSIAATDAFGTHTAAVGKSMMFRRSVLEGLGGLRTVGPVLAEDWVLGRMFTEAGLDVRLSTAPVANVCVRTTVAAFLRRHARWGLIRSRILPRVHALEPLSNTMLPAVLGVAIGGDAGMGLVGAGLCLTFVRDAVQWWALRGLSGLARALPLGPLKELAMLGVWLVAPFMGRVTWRGRLYRVGVGTHLFATGPVTPGRAWRCERGDP